MCNGNHFLYYQFCRNTGIWLVVPGENSWSALLLVNWNPTGRVYFSKSYPLNLAADGQSPALMVRKLIPPLKTTLKKLSQRTQNPREMSMTTILLMTTSATEVRLLMIATVHRFSFIFHFAYVKFLNHIFYNNFNFFFFRFKLQLADHSTFSVILQNQFIDDRYTYSLNFYFVINEFLVD